MKITPLNKWHKRHGANMAEFGGYEMPLWYSSAKSEHLSVLTHAGIFDTSHMAVVTIEGQDAFKLLQRCFSRDLRSCIGPVRHPLAPGQCVYGVFLNNEGHVVDDAIIDQVGNHRYLCVVNAGMGGMITQHLTRHTNNMDVALCDLTDQIGKMDIQGPLSARVLKKILKDPEKAFENMPYFTFKGSLNHSRESGSTILLKNDIPILLSRTGYTGEFGFEIFSDTARVVEIWEMVLEAGEEFGITPCGLAARDSLRAGAVLPLSHQDIGHWPFLRNPWTFALPYDISQTGFTKEFVGSRALLDISNADYTYPFIGYDLRKVSLSDKTEVMDKNRGPVGTVLTCVSDMGIGRTGEQIYSIASPNKPKGFTPRGLSCGFVKVNRKLASGDVIELRDKRRAIKVAITGNIRPARTARIPIQKMIQ